MALSQIDEIQQKLTEMFAAPLPELYRRRVVFWSDERGEFAANVDELSLPGVRTIKLDGHNSFRTKKTLLRDDPEGSYLIYDPLTYKEPQDDWLLDIRLMSEEFRADKASMFIDEMGLDRSPEIRQTVRDHIRFFENRDRRKAFKALRPKYENPRQITTGIVAVLAGAAKYAIADIVIAALSGGLEAIEKFGASDYFWDIVCGKTGFKASEHDRDLSALRTHLFISALASAVGTEALGGLEAWFDAGCLQVCASIAREWLARDRDDKLFDVMREIEDEMRLSARFDDMDIETLTEAEIFIGAHEAILKRIFADAANQSVRAGVIEGAVKAARTSHWYGRYEQYYECAMRIAEVKSFEEQHRDGFHFTEPERVFEFYTSQAYKVDTAYRKFHLAFGKTLAESNERLDDLLKRAAKDLVEPIYKDWFLRELNSCWINAARGELASKGSVEGPGTARRFYSCFPGADTTAHSFVVISDALRYEVAAEIREKIEATNIGSVKLDGLQSIFPSITKFGMAALLPGNILSLSKTNDVMVDDMPTRSTADRTAILAASEPDSIAIKYTELKTKTQDEKRAMTRGKRVVYIYHDAIDAVGDKAATEDKVFTACEDAVRELSDLVRMIVNQMNGTNVYITADHGFLYTYSALDESDKIGREMITGEILEDGRRYIIASKDAEAPYMVPICMDYIKAEGEIKGFAPLDTIRIKKPGGGDRYVHGGISLQEFAVPVLTFKRIRKENKSYVETRSPGIELLMQTRRVTNMNFTLKFMQKLPVGGSVQSCSYTISMIDAAGEEVSQPRTLIADKTSDSPNERTFSLSFALNQGRYDKNSSYTLRITSERDAETRIPFIIDIPMGGDYGFDL